jgi:predicted dehydrogenase
MKRVKTAVIGTGFMGRTHLEALRRVENVDVVAIAGHSLAPAKALGEGYGIAKIVDDYRAVINDPGIDAVHVCTPNATHHAIVKAALNAGKHVLCEKPLAVTVEEARELETLAADKGLRAGLCHNLRYYPLVQQIRRMREAGELGEILVAQGTYSQDWLLYDTDWNWRIDPAAAGPLRAMADIGSHWFDMMEHLTGLKVSALCTDLQTFHPVRKRPLKAVETFSGKLGVAGETADTAVTTDDFGAVMFHLGERARGVMTASQVAAGRKNGLSIEIYGSKAAAAWNQERPDELWIGNRNSPNQVLIKDPSLLKPEAAAYAGLPGGHDEGYADTFKQLFRRFYASVSDPALAPEYPTMADGVRQMEILKAELASHRAHGWVEMDRS